MTPTQRSLKVLRDDGYICEVVERWLPGINCRRDLFNMADILAIKAGARPLLVQVTAAGVAARVAKIRNSELLGAVIEHFDIEVHGWRKSARNGRYVQRIITIG